jgi:hypothetical protein
VNAGATIKPDNTIFHKTNINVCFFKATPINSCIFYREFSAKMMTRDLRIPFYVKKKYQPQSKEELLQLWTNVENDWRSRKKT